MDTKYKANQELNPLSTYPVWSSLFEQISPRSNTGEKSQVTRGKSHRYQLVQTCKKPIKITRYNIP